MGVLVDALHGSLLGFRPPSPSDTWAFLEWEAELLGRILMLVTTNISFGSSNSRIQS